MKPTPIHLIVSRLKRMHLNDRVEELVRLVALEKPHSIRRNELLSLLEGAKRRQIKIQSRKQRRAA
jgi:hypothetical protein